MKVVKSGDFICSFGPPNIAMSPFDRKWVTPPSDSAYFPLSFLSQHIPDQHLSLSFLSLSLMHHVGGREEDRVSTVPPITCEISEPGHAERGYCVPLMRNALASLLKEKASFGQEFGGISRSVGEIFSGVGMRRRSGQEQERPTQTDTQSLIDKHSHNRKWPQRLSTFFILWTLSFQSQSINNLTFFFFFSKKP